MDSNKTGKSRNGCRLSLAAEGMEVSLDTDRHPETNNKCSEIAFAVTSLTLSLEHLAKGPWRCENLMENKLTRF